MGATIEEIKKLLEYLDRPRFDEVVHNKPKAFGHCPMVIEVCT